MADIVDHSIRAHSPWGASAAHRWFTCPGSVRRCSAVPPRPSSPYAEEGTRAHELLESTLVYKLTAHTPMESAKETALYHERLAAAPQDMRDGVQTALDHVEFLTDLYPDAVVLVEHKFNIPTDAAPEPVFGTNDICVFLPSIRTLHVIDYKHGAGVPVEVIGNEQLRFYGVGAIFSLPQWHVERVVLTIIQPRCFHPAGPIRDEHISVADLIEFQAVIDEHIALTMKDDAPLVPSDKGCRWCDAKPGCPAVEAKALRVISDDFATVKTISQNTMPVVPQMPLDKIGYVLQMRKFVESWFDDVKAHAEELAKQGMNIPGHKLVEGMARRKWHGTEDELTQQIIALSDFELTEEQLRPRSLLTLTAVETMLCEVAKAGAKRGHKKEAVIAVKNDMAFLTTKDTSGKISLVSEEDRRPAVTPGAAFANVVLLPKI